MWEFICKTPLWVWPLFLWDLIWKIIALWRSAKNKHFKWFFAILILNTVGILPLIYLFKYKKN
jgi:hypothetical protein